MESLLNCCFHRDTVSSLLKGTQDFSAKARIWQVILIISRLRWLMFNVKTAPTATRLHGIIAMKSSMAKSCGAAGNLGNVTARWVPRDAAGSCNFCSDGAKAGKKVLEVQGHGVSVRFCRECFGVVKRLGGPAGEDVELPEDIDVTTDAEQSSGEQTRVERLVGPSSCPCCNSASFVYQESDGWVVRCGGCGTQSKIASTSEAARRLWNRRFDGQYGISARELESDVVTVIRQWFEHSSKTPPKCLKHPERHPLSQVVTGCLNSLL